MLQCSNPRCKFLVHSDNYRGNAIGEGDKCPWCRNGLTRGSKGSVSSPTTDPLVSIVVPLYNSEPWLSALSETIRAQSYKNIEVVLSGDNCDPASLKGISFFRGLNFVCIGSPRRQGISITTNRGIMQARGDLILHMDHDDGLTPNCVEVLVKALQNHPEWGAVYGAQDIQTDKETISGAGGSFRRLSMLGTNIMGHPVMVRKHVMVQCLPDPRDDLAQDAGYNLLLSENCQIGRVDEILYVWNIHGENPSIVRKMEQAKRLKGTSTAAISRRLTKPSICFVLPGLGICGGIRLVLEAANRLKDRGWDIWVADLTLGGRCELTSKLDAAPPPECFVPLRVPVVAGIPQWCDIAVATGWDTVLPVLEHQVKGNGIAAWYVQNWEEGWSINSIDQPDMIKHVVVCAEHLQERLLGDWGVQSTIINSAVDLTQFPFLPRQSGCAPAPARVLIPWRESKYKNPDKLLKIMRLLKANGKDLLILCPHEPRPGLREEFEGCWRINPPQDQLAKLYSISDMTVTSSISEGHSVITLEALAVGSIPVVQRVGNEESIVSESGILLPNDATPEDYLDAINQLESVRCNWMARRRRGRAHIEMNFTWDRTVDRWEKFLLDVAYQEYGPFLDRISNVVD